jgi:hypothetical protein
MDPTTQKVALRYLQAQDQGLEGLTRARAETYLRKLTQTGTSGVHRDSDWKPITAIFDRLSAAGIPIQNYRAEYYSNRNSPSLTSGKQWTFEIPFSKGGWYVTVTASFMGSTQDPSEAYDIVVTMSYSARLSWGR